jgi:hypothetical protein
MASFDRTYGAARTDAGSRVHREMRLDWSALFGGSLIGWGTMLLLSMVAMIVGLAAIDPFAVRPATSNAGAAIWGAASAIIASFVGAFAVLRLAGDRRRGESLMHGAVSWGMSMLLAGLIALFASGVAAFSRTPVNSNAMHRPARGSTAALVETTGDGGVVALLATGGALLSLAASLLGALAAASRSSGVPFGDELRPRRRATNGHHAEIIAHESDVRRDETTIIPPTH